LKLERYYEAITDCTASIDRQPTVKAYARRAAARAALHHYELASVDYKRALAFEPNNQVCLAELIKCLENLQGQLKRQMQQFTAPDEALKRMVREIRNDIGRYGKYLKDAEERNRLLQIVTQHSALIQRDKCNSTAYLRRAECYVQLNEIDKAIMDYKSGLRYVIQSNSQSRERERERVCVCVCVCVCV
jgi:tetratricopeptide (TPR) repeat protein